MATTAAMGTLKPDIDLLSYLFKVLHVVTYGYLQLLATFFFHFRINFLHTSVQFNYKC